MSKIIYENDGMGLIFLENNLIKFDYFNRSKIALMGTLHFCVYRKTSC